MVNSVHFLRVNTTMYPNLRATESKYSTPYISARLGKTKKTTMNTTNAYFVYCTKLQFL